MQVFTEKDWSDLKSGLIQPYPESKTRAELAAWDFVKAEKSFELTVINPSLIVGPVIRRCPFSSVEVIANLVERRFSAVPDLNLWAVDVRDVAEAHIRALVRPAAAGKRFILSAREIPMRAVSYRRSCAFICTRSRAGVMSLLTPIRVRLRNRRWLLRLLRTSTPRGSMCQLRMPPTFL